jgi:hypothetical protein
MAPTALSNNHTGPPLISKSKFLWRTQCKKLLWVAYHAKDQIPARDNAHQAIFDQGHEVGALAKLMVRPAIRTRPRSCCHVGSRTNPISQSTPKTIKPGEQPKEKAKQQRQNDNQSNLPKPHSLLPSSFFAFIHAVYVP